jgi:hypothetical protein
MRSGRRFFLSGLAATLASAGEVLAAGQRHGTLDIPNPQIPDASGSGADTETAPPRPDPKVQLEEDQKILKRDVDRLLQLAKELKDESDKTRDTDVLSLSNEEDRRN